MSELDSTLRTRCPEIVNHETKQTCGAMAKVVLGNIFESTDGFIQFANTECSKEHRLNLPTSMLGEIMLGEDSAKSAA